MDKLRQIVQDKTRQQDPIWSSLYNTDIRNLFPKYELSKIQKSKTKYDKFRLMMENIDDFLCLEKHRKDTKISGEQIQDIMEELKELEDGEFGEVQMQRQRGGKQRDRGYHPQIIQLRQTSQKITSQLTRYITQTSTKTAHKNKILQHLIKSNKKWSQYMETNFEKPPQTTKQQKFVEQVQLSQTIEIPSSHQISNNLNLNQSTPSQILFNRLKKKYIMKRLLNLWGRECQGEQKDGDGVDGVEKEFLQDWKIVVKGLEWDKFV